MWRKTTCHPSPPPPPPFQFPSAVLWGLHEKEGASRHLCLPLIPCSVPFFYCSTMFARITTQVTDYYYLPVAPEMKLIDFLFVGSFSVIPVWSLNITVSDLQHLCRWCLLAMLKLVSESAFASFFIALKYIGGFCFTLDGIFSEWRWSYHSLWSYLRSVLQLHFLYSRYVIGFLWYFSKIFLGEFY